MAADPVETAKRWIDAYQRRDFEALRAVADPDVELRMADGRELKGHDGLAQVAKHGWEAELPHYPRAQRYATKDDTVYAILDVELRNPETDEVVRTLLVGGEWKVRDGRVVAWAARPDREQLLKDGGFPE